MPTQSNKGKWAFQQVIFKVDIHKQKDEIGPLPNILNIKWKMNHRFKCILCGDEIVTVIIHCQLEKLTQAGLWACL